MVICKLRVVDFPEFENTVNGHPVIRAQNYGMKGWINDENQVKSVVGGDFHPESFFARLSEDEIVRYDIDEERREQLKHFFGNRNYLSYVPFRYLENVRTLDLSNTQVMEIPALPSHLRILAISNTGISQLPPFPDTLRILKASNTNLQELPLVPERMLKISVRYNRLRTLPFESIQRCHDLIELRYDGNPFRDVFPETFLRWLELQFQRVHGNEENQRKVIQFRLERKGGRDNRFNRIYDEYQQIYGNDNLEILGIRKDIKPVVTTISQSGQNVHDRRILNQLVKAYHILGENLVPLEWDNQDEYIMGMTHQDIIINLWVILKSILSNKGDVKVDSNFWDNLWKSVDVTTSGILKPDGTFHENITLARTMGYVFGWYVKNNPLEKWRDIMEVLAGEWIEWQTVCMTGRLMRCVNLLSGIHPEFKVEVPIGEQIQQKYNYLYKKYVHRFPPENWLEQPYRIMQYYEETIYLWNDFAQRFKESLEEIEISQEVIEEWVNPLKENAKELEEEMKNKYPEEYVKLLEKRKNDSLNVLLSQMDYESKHKEKSESESEEEDDF